MKTVKELTEGTYHLERVYTWEQALNASSDANEVYPQNYVVSELSLELQSKLEGNPEVNYKKVATDLNQDNPRWLYEVSANDAKFYIIVEGYLEDGVSMLRVRTEVIGAVTIEQ